MYDTSNINWKPIKYSLEVFNLDEPMDLHYSYIKCVWYN